MLCDVELDDTPGRLLATGYAPLRQALLSAAAVLASEQLGLAEQLLGDRRSST